MKFTSKENHGFTPLERAIAGLEAMNIQLGKARSDYLILEAERKHFEANLINAQLGKGYSHAQKVSEAQSMPEWLTFHKALARKEAEYEFIKLKFQIMEKSWQSLYLETKLDASLIKKQE